MTRLPGITIDRCLRISFYFQLAEVLEQEISSGHWESGTPLPSEPELCERYNLSRATIRQALTRLEQRGLIHRREGQGTFVQRGQPGLRLLQSSEGFFQDEVDQAGRTVTSHVLRVKRGRLPIWACDALKRPRGSPGATLERLRSVDGDVALYGVNHLISRVGRRPPAVRHYRAWLCTDRTRIEMQVSVPAAAVTQPLAARKETGR